MTIREDKEEIKTISITETQIKDILGIKGEIIGISRSFSSFGNPLIIFEVILK